MFETEPSGHTLSQEPLAFHLGLSPQLSVQQLLGMGGGRADPNYSCPQLPTIWAKIRTMSEVRVREERGHSSVLDQGQNQSGARGKI